MGGAESSTPTGASMRAKNAAEQTDRRTLIPSRVESSRKRRPGAEFSPHDLTMILESSDPLSLLLLGEFDLSRCEDFEAAVEEVYAPEIELDLSQLNFIDSSGIRCLIQLQQRVQNDGGSIAIDVGSSPIMRTFEIAGLTGVLAIRSGGLSR
jgi:anti-sigma B factor antagonist